jgi:thioredoxin 1
MKVLKFYADWCAPCKALTGIIDEYYKGDIPIESVNIEEQSDMALKYKVRGVPVCVLLDDDGNELKSQTGMMMIDQFEKFLQI